METNQQTAPPVAWQNRIVGHATVPAKDLLANPKNWRIHPTEQQAALARVLDKVGWVQDVVVNRTTGFIVDGHLRAVLAAEQDQVVPVAYVELTAAEEDLILATFDQITGMAVPDAEKLSALMAEVSTEFPDLSDMLDRITASGEPEPDQPEGGGLTEEDAAPEPPVVPVTAKGDVWLLGPHRLLCGDATDAGDVERLLDGDSPVLMATDPPYGVEYDPEWRATAGVNKSRSKLGKVQNDNRADWREAWALFPGDVMYVWHAGRHAATVQQSIEACGFEIRSQIIWAKDRFALSRGNYHWQHEPCWYAVRNNGHWNGDRSQTTLWHINAREDGGHGHGTQKPVECMRRPMRNSSRLGQVVYDPFLGSGTSIIAAQTAGRICYGMEIDPAYCDASITRWQAFTGDDATLASDGRTFRQAAEIRTAAVA